jgi:hypothetical protein
MFISPRDPWSAAMSRTTLGTEPTVTRARPRSVRRPQSLVELNPMRAANPRRAARSRSRVPTPPPTASNPRAAPLDRASQVAAPVFPATGSLPRRWYGGPCRLSIGVSRLRCQYRLSAVTICTDPSSADRAFRRFLRTSFFALFPPPLPRPTFLLRLVRALRVGGIAVAARQERIP